VNLLPKTVSAPNGLTTEFFYHPAVGDLRLQEIKHQLAGPTPLSTQAYTYSPEGNIKSWEQTVDTSPAKTWGISYDRADQLEAATLTDSSAAVLEQHAWRYDKIGNRTSRQNGPQITQTTHNNRNQIDSESPGGWMRVRGTTDEPAIVKVRSNNNPFTPATTTAANEFSGWVTTVPGANSVTIEAKNYSPTAPPTTNSYTVNITGSSRTPGYDLNGNTTDNGTGQTYDWDAENRLIKITYADNSSTAFTYDGLSRRVRITEKNAASAVITDKRYVWAGGNQPAEERNAAGSTVLKQYHPQGEYVPAASAPLNKLFYTKDHLGSIRELVDANGIPQTRYDYDMWGKRVKVSGTAETDVGYTGHHHHAKSGLILTWYRVYDADSGRWLSADPIGESGGMNLYGYVGGNPIGAIDNLGLDIYVIYDESSPTAGGYGHAAMITGQSGGQHLLQSFGAAQGGCSGSSEGNELFEKLFPTRADALAAAKGLGYDKYNSWTTDLAGDRSARESFRKRAKGYNVTSNNCTNAAMAGLDSAGVRNNTDSNVPNKHYDYNSDESDQSGYLK
jgi:RHS repeat-associated protein